MGPIEKLFVVIGAKSTVAKDVEDGVIKPLDGLEGKIGGVGGKIAGAFDKIGAAIITMGAAAAAATVTAVIGLGTQMLEAAGKLDTYEASLTALSGSAEVAKEKMGWLKDFASGAPFEIPGIMEAAVNLETFGLNAETYMGILGDTAAALGVDIDTVSKGLTDSTMGNFEALKNFGINATKEGSQIAFDYLDKNGEQQRIMVDANNQELIASTVASIWNEKYQGAMDTMASSWEGMVQGLKNTFEVALADAGAVILPAIKPFIDEIGVFLSSEEFTSMFESVGELFADIVDAFGPIVLDALKQISGMFGGLVDTVQSSGLIEALGEIASALSGLLLDVLASALPLAKLGIELLAGALDIIAPAISSFADFLGDVVGFLLSWPALLTAAGIGLGVMATGLIAAGGGVAILTTALEVAMAHPVLLAISGITALVYGLWEAFGGGEDSVQKVIDQMQKIENEWDTMTRVQRDATIEQLELFALQAEAAGVNADAVAKMREEIEKLRDIQNSNERATKDWNDTWADTIDNITTITDIGFKELGETFNTYGGELVAKGKEIPDSILKQFETDTPEMLSLLQSTMSGAVTALQEYTGLTEIESRAFADVLSQTLANLGGNLGAMTQAQFDNIKTLTGMTDKEVMDLITRLTGYTSTDLPNIQIDATDNATATAEGTYARIKEIFGQPIYQQIYSIFHGPGEAPPAHTGGLIRHQV